jgi:hypothetical protein
MVPWRVLPASCHKIVLQHTCCSIQHTHGSTLSGSLLRQFISSVCVQLSWSELNRKMMEPVEEANRAAPEQQMVAIQNAADWEVDLAPGLLSQVVDLSPYVNSSALKVNEHTLVGIAGQAVCKAGSHRIGMLLPCFAGNVHPLSQGFVLSQQRSGLACSVAAVCRLRAVF